MEDPLDRWIQMTPNEVRVDLSPVIGAMPGSLQTALRWSVGAVFVASVITTMLMGLGGALLLGSASVDVLVFTLAMVCGMVAVDVALAWSLWRLGGMGRRPLRTELVLDARSLTVEQHYRDRSDRWTRGLSSIQVVEPGDGGLVIRMADEVHFVPVVERSRATLDGIATRLNERLARLEKDSREDIPDALARMRSREVE